MSSHKVKTRSKKQKQQKKSNVIVQTTKNISFKITNWNQKRKEKKAEKQALLELNKIFNENLKSMANKKALFEIAHQMDIKADKIRQLAKEIL